MPLARSRPAILAALVVLLAALTVAVAPTRADAALSSIHLTAAGDYSSTSNTTAVLTGIAAARPAFNLALGDLSYGTAGQEQAWCDYVRSKVGPLPFELLSGNHESNGRNGDIAAFAACLPNALPGISPTSGYGREYAVDVPADRPVARVVAISPGLTFSSGTWTYTKGDAHYAWTAKVIDDARAKGIPWVIVAMHKPCTSLGNYACPTGSQGPGTDITNLLLAKKVDLVLHGHEHLYQRTHQLRNGVAGCTSLVVNRYASACVADRDGSFARGAGTVFATVGTGGTPLRNLDAADPEARYFAASSAANRNPAYGFLDLDVSMTTLRARFVATGGQAVDSFALTRPGLVADELTRSVPSGWGTAPVGGAWLPVGAPSDLSVSGGTGRITARAPAATGVRSQVRARDTDTRFVVSADALPVGGTVAVRTAARLGPGGAYAGVLRLSPDGSVAAGITRTTSGAVTVLRSPATVLRTRAGGRLNVRVRVTGVSPTTIRVRVWAAGSAEPAAWSATATDSTSALQVAGVARLDVLPAASVSGPVTLRVDDVAIDRP